MIPGFDVHGLIPAIRPGAEAHSNERAPFPTDMLTFCQRFGGTAERRRILTGLLELREALRTLGIVEGYQWLDGSFVEDVEFLQGRPPNDIDVVTFAVLGDEASQREKFGANPEVLNPGSKTRFKVDHYILATDCMLDEAYARRIGYWHSMWSHQRETMRLKGFVSVNLASNDEEALVWLGAQIGHEGGAI
ncbi:DUF6932 family protein [Lujinxingia litoralis]|nr:hypothetical protein [Lujinxingia litoralis]